MVEVQLRVSKLVITQSSAKASLKDQSGVLAYVSVIRASQEQNEAKKMVLAGEREVLRTAACHL